MLISLKESQYWVDNCLTLCLSEIEAAIKFNDRKLSRIDRQTFQFNPQKTWIFLVCNWDLIGGWCWLVCKSHNIESIANA